MRPANSTGLPAHVRQGQHPAAPPHPGGRLRRRHGRLIRSVPRAQLPGREGKDDLLLPQLGHPGGHETRSLLGSTVLRHRQTGTAQTAEADDKENQRSRRREPPHHHARHAQAAGPPRPTRPPRSGRSRIPLSDHTPPMTTPPEGHARWARGNTTRRRVRNFVLLVDRGAPSPGQDGSPSTSRSSERAAGTEGGGVPPQPQTGAAGGGARQWSRQCRAHACLVWRHVSHKGPRNLMLSRSLTRHEQHHARTCCCRHRRGRSVVRGNRNG